MTATFYPLSKPHKKKISSPTAIHTHTLAIIKFPRRTPSSHTQKKNKKKYPHCVAYTRRPAHTQAGNH